MTEGIVEEMEFEVNLDLLKATKVFAGKDKARPVLTQVAAVFNADDVGTAPMFVATNSYALVIGHNVGLLPADAIAACDKRDAIALIDSDEIERLSKMAPKAKDQKALFLSEIWLQLTRQGGDTERYRYFEARLKWGSYLSKHGLRSGFPSFMSLIRRSDEPLPVRKVGMGVDRLNEMVTAAKMVGAEVVDFGGATERAEMGPQFFTIKGDRGWLTGLVMPVKTNYKWTEEG